MEITRRISCSNELSRHRIRNKIPQQHSIRFHSLMLFLLYYFQDIQLFPFPFHIHLITFFSFSHRCFLRTFLRDKHTIPCSTSGSSVTYGIFLKRMHHILTNEHSSYTIMNTIYCKMKYIGKCIQCTFFT
jgi:hypothetical protein